MFKILFNIALELCGTMIQIILTPFNLAISRLLPTFTAQVVSGSEAIISSFHYVTWAVSGVPASVITTLSFCITFEIALFTIWITVRAVIRVWEVVQKIKFW